MVLLNDRPDARPRPAGRVERLELGEHAEHLGRALRRPEPVPQLRSQLDLRSEVNNFE